MDQLVLHLQFTLLRNQVKYDAGGERDTTPSSRGRRGLERNPSKACVCSWLRRCASQQGAHIVQTKGQPDTRVTKLPEALQQSKMTKEIQES